MNNIVLDAKEFTNKDKFHDIMQEKFNLPSYYGRNLDALWDLLTESSAYNILIMNADKLESNLGEYGKSILKLFDELSNIQDNKVDYIFGGCFREELNFSKKDSKFENKNYTLKNLDEYKINLSETTYIAEGARLSGSILTGENVSIWYNATIRADYSTIEIGDNSNIQDNAVIHLSHDSKVKIGKNVTVGHTAIIHGARIEDNVIIGMGAIVLDDAVIGKNSIVGAGALVTKGKIIPEGSLVLGSPAKVVRDLSEEEIDSILRNAEDYVENAKRHFVK